MHQLYYQPPGHWFGDCMPFFHDGKFYLYHQRDNRNPCPFGEPFGWALVRTEDFVHFEDLGESLLRGGDDAQDQFIFAGSVFGAQGKFHAMYTGYNRDFPSQGRASQVMMRAQSDDLIHWEKTGETVVAPQPGYDKDDWRDPFVFWNSQENQYNMILGGRKLDGEKLRNGCTVRFSSPDLKNWTFRGQFWAPELYTMHEMPDLFQLDSWWYLIISEYSDGNKIVYRRAKSLDGPWLAPEDDAFDGRAYYAGRTMAGLSGRYLFGWVPTKENCLDTGNYEWAGALVVHEVCARPDGTLCCKPPQGVMDAFRSPVSLPECTISSEDKYVLAPLCRKTGTLFKLTAKVRFSPGTRDFGVHVMENSDTGDAYRYMISPNRRRMICEKTPNTPWYNMMTIGLERPVFLEPDADHDLILIVDDTIATLYLDGVALNTRMYQATGEALSFFVYGGTLQAREITLSTELSEK